MYKRILRKPPFRRFALVGIAVFSAVAIILFQQLGGFQSSLETGRWFNTQPLGVGYHLLDLGVVDINDDGWLDIFTSNHDMRQSMLVNDATGGFSDQLLALGLSQNSEFPGIEPSESIPIVDAAGLYIYWHKSELVIHARDVDSLSSATGKIHIADWVSPDSIASNTKGNLQATTVEDKTSGKEKQDIEFSAKGEGQLILHTRQYAIFETVFELDQQLPLDRVYVGSERIHPSSHKFGVRPGKDRHGIAWADYNGDQQMDVFISRGGGSGTMDPNSAQDKDELLIQNNHTFYDETASSKLTKDACPSRQVGAVDFDGDEQLDIYVVCGRNKPPRQAFPNQLHRQDQGQFRDVAAERGVDILESGSFLWLDADTDGDVDLFWAGNDQKLWLYDNQGSRFDRQPVGQSRGRVKQLTLSDYDADGDFDIFVASDKSILLTNDSGSFAIVDPSSLGLPTKGYAANWVDYNNDGLVDLHVLPGGIYQQHENHRFEATHLLEVSSFSLRNHNAFFSTWFDADNDGSRDLLAAIEDKPYAWLPSKLGGLWEKLSQPANVSSSISKWDITLYSNVGTSNHWLQLQLIDTGRNSQAIGARVEVVTAGRKQLQVVGQADGAADSQGHYRLYFGLGQNETADSVKIFWPDKTLQALRNVEADQLLQIERTL